jgi:cytochrome c oxidase subunit 4
MQGLTSDHIVPVRTYFLVAGGLFALLAVTVGISLVDLGSLNIVAALAIAVAKMLLVVLFFMHVRWSSRLVWLFASGGLLWLAILFMLTMSDFLTR